MPNPLPEDPSRFMQDMPASNPLAGEGGPTVPDPKPSMPPPTDPPVPPAGDPPPAEPPVSDQEPLPVGNPFKDLDDDEQNSFDEEEVLSMEHMTRE